MKIGAKLATLIDPELHLIKMIPDQGDVLAFYGTKQQALAALQRSRSADSRPVKVIPCYVLGEGAATEAAGLLKKAADLLDGDPLSLEIRNFLKDQAHDL